MDVSNAIQNGLGLASELVSDLTKAKAAAGASGVIVELEQLAIIVLADPAVKQSFSALLAAL